MRLLENIKSFRFALLTFVLAATLNEPTPSLAAKSQYEIRQEVSALLRKTDYTGLEALVASLKAKEYRIDERPDLEKFYKALSLNREASEEVYSKRRAALEAWVAAIPQSSSAHTALADWWVDYAWKARGNGWASSVTPEGWKLMKERLDKAEEVLLGISFDKVDDPEYYRIWLTVALGQGWSMSQMDRYFERGTALAKGYFPLYNCKGYFLLPKWCGDEESLEDFASEAADEFPGEAGDLLYGDLIQLKASDYGDDFFSRSKADYARAKRGFEYGMQSEDRDTRFRSTHSLCHLAAVKGDEATTTRLFLEIGPRYNTSYFVSLEDFHRHRRQSDAFKQIEAARALEREGKIEEAEKAYAAFPTNPKSKNQWLEGFYLKHGKKEQYRASKERSLYDVNVATASPDALCEVAREAPLLGEWKTAEEAAQRFDSKRPWNLTGRATLFLCAAKNGDSARTEALLKSFLEYKSDRPAYQQAQAVLGGRTSWRDAADSFKKCDGYNQQAALTIAACYAAQGKYALARNVAETMAARCEESPAYFAIFESLLHGSLAPLLKDHGSH